MTAFGCKEIGAQKIKKAIFFQYMLYSLKAHAHCFTVFINLETWRGAKIGIFTHFIFTNLPWCIQSMNSLIYVYSLQIPSWSQTWSHFFVLLPPKKKFLYYPLMGLQFWPWSFHQQGQGFHSREVREFVRGSRKVLEKVREENFYPCKFLTFKKNMCMKKCVQLNCIWQSVLYMMLLFASSIKII